MKDRKLKIEYMDIEDLKTYPNNAKIHTAEQIEQIKRSIEEFVFNDPIAVWSEKNEIVEGHGRLMAAQELGIKKVPIIRLDDLSDGERRAYMLVHNKLTMNTGFDEDLLAMELDNLAMDMEQFDFKLNMDDLGDINRDDLSDQFNLAMRVVIECESEQQQQEIYDEMVGRGFTCKIE